MQYSIAGLEWKFLWTVVLQQQIIQREVLTLEPLTASADLKIRDQIQICVLLCHKVEHSYLVCRTND